MSTEIINKPNAEIVKQVTSYMAQKAELQKQVDQLNRFENLYYNEIKSLKNRFHTTAAGATIFLGDMEEDHLLNTAVLFSKKFGEQRNSPAQKYLNEIKSRGIMQKYLDRYDGKRDKTVESDDLDLSDVDWDYDY
jgi:hypothetical protein